VQQAFGSPAVSQETRSFASRPRDRFAFSWHSRMESLEMSERPGGATARPPRLKGRLGTHHRQTSETRGHAGVKESCCCPFSGRVVRLAAVWVALSQRVVFPPRSTMSGRLHSLRGVRCGTRAGVTRFEKPNAARRTADFPLRGVRERARVCSTGSCPRWPATWMPATWTLFVAACGSRRGPCVYNAKRRAVIRTRAGGWGGPVGGASRYRGKGQDFLVSLLNLFGRKSRPGGGGRAFEGWR